MAKRVLIISIKAGAGHLRAAQALEAAFGEQFPDLEIRHIEALEYTNKAFQRSFTAVATDAMAYALREKGIGASQVSVTGIPLMPVSAETYPSAPTMRRKLGLAPDATTVLLSAGGFGLAGIDETVALLAARHEDVQFVAIAGKNEALRQALESAAKAGKGRIVPCGFVTNMHEYMAASDFFVGKCGGLTSSECLAMGLPMVILDPIPGQEERNATYLLENGVALRANTNAHVQYKVSRILDNPALLGTMQDAARRIARPRAAFDVARIVAEAIG